MSQRYIALSLILFCTLLSTEAFARSAPYAPGETLDPTCPPSEANCTVIQISVDTATNNFGIGTTSPYAKLSVVGQIVGAYFTATTTTASLFPYASTTAIGATGSAYFATSGGFVGIGTTSPYAKLSVVGETVASYFTATTTTATSTFAGGIDVGSGGLAYDFSSGATHVDYLEIGATSFDTNAGVVSWADIPVTSSAIAGTPQSYTAHIGGSSVLTVYGESDGAEGVQNLAVGIATSSPSATFAVSGSTYFAGNSTTTGTFTASSTVRFGPNSLTASDGTQKALCIDAATGFVVNSGASSCTLSSIRFKHDVQDFFSGLSVVKALRPVSFKLNADNSEHLGFIAEEVALIEERLIFTEQGSTTPRGVRYEEMTAVLARAIQEQQKQIDALFASLKDVKVDNLTVGNVAKPSGITLFDEINGAPYCLKISGGVTKTIAGECARLATIGASSTPSLDTEPPTITLLGNNPATIQKGSSYIDPGATVVDNVDGNLGVRITGDQFDTSIPATHLVTFTATDNSGNTATSTRSVIVQNTNESEASSTTTATTTTATTTHQ